MDILFVIDKVELKYFEFNDLVTNFWIIKELLANKKNVYITTNSRMFLKGNSAYAEVFESFPEGENIFYKKESFDIKLDDLDLIIFRPDPPVDTDYINATYVLDFTETKVINNHRTIRDFNEKIHAVIFNEYMPENITTSSKSKIEDFLEEHREIILKPLNKCFGSGVMYLHSGDPNTRTIINSMTSDENSLVMVQKFIPAVKYGDKRVLTLGDRVLDECIIKLPTSDDFKFNTHSDNYIKKGVLTAQEKSDFTKVAKKLNSMGIYMSGLDVVDGKIIEINVTSPCYFIKEINNCFNTHLEYEICDYILSTVSPVLV